MYNINISIIIYGLLYNYYYCIINIASILLVQLLLFFLGEVPGLFESEELEKAINTTRPDAKRAGVSEENRDGIYEFFINRTRKNLHLVLCMSPVGDAFRLSL